MVYKFSFSSLFYPLAFLMVGYVLFTLKIMGAGDSKYLFSIYLVLPVTEHEESFLCLAYTTTVVGLCLFLINIFSNSDKIKIAILSRNVSMIRNIFGKKFSYAPVILLSWLWFGWKRKLFIY